MPITKSLSPAMRPLLCTLSLLIAGFCTAQTQSNQPEKPIRIPSSGGEVVIATAAEKAAAYDQYHYSPSRRVGDTLYISGVVVGRRDGEGKDVAAFKAQVRRAFQRIQATLNAAGANFDDVVMLNTFHVWQGPNFEGDRPGQFAAFSAVKDEFMKPPYPAWTAIGTTSLIPDNGIVEIQVIVHLNK
ncbi:MAG TPA: RidA family protein [Edaphobacter sp.]|nr:RidA family protein [Edaphobacter sp.]